jgi:hypothetical protein
MSTLDLSKEFKGIYKAGITPELIEVPEGNFLMIDGKGSPDSIEYSEAMQALYGVAYTLKFHYKSLFMDFKVMALEGLWWVNDGVFDMTNPAPREKWMWTSMIRVPDYVDESTLGELMPQLIEKRGEKVKEVKLGKFNEGISAQIMHIGPYSEEAPTIIRLHRWVEENGFKLRGDHHEIYMSDPRRTRPEKLKTIIRHPVEKNS